MTTRNSNNNFGKWLPIVFGAGLLVSFFLPWVSWQGNMVSGYDMPRGYFFSLAETKLGLGNPFPQINFSFNVFWLIPAGALASIILVAINKKWSLAAFITGALSLSLLAVFFLFTQKLIMLGVGRNVFAMLQPAAWLQAVSAIGLIITTTTTSSALLKKAAWIAAGPVFVFISFLIMEKYLMGETFSDTAGVKADYTVTASDLFHEFAANDSAANKKYREKIITVNGTAAEVDKQSDSTTNIKYADSTGSYIVFSLDKNQYEKVKNIKPGDAVSLKGSCSGSVYSDILSTTAISFKRSTLNKQ
jgi:tRNA_anti-like